MVFKNDIIALIMDDDPLHRQYMKGLLTTILYPSSRVFEAPDGEEALRVVERTSPDICILDLQIPDKKSGIEIAKEAWEKDASLRILFWSQYSDELYVRKLFSIVPEDAIYGFLIKTALDDDVINALRYILEYDQCWIDPKIRKLRQTTFDKETGLTDVEYETLVDLVLGLSDNAMANRRFITKRGIQNRLASLYNKLGVAEEQHESEKWGHMYSPRTRTVAMAFMRGLINQEALRKENEYLQTWIEKLL